jgi:hypothetical protein
MLVHAKHAIEELQKLVDEVKAKEGHDFEEI